MATKKRAAKKAAATPSAIEAQPIGGAFGPAVEAEPKYIAKDDGVARITIELPVGPPDPKGYLPRKVETRLDQTSSQPLILRRIFDGMQSNHEQLDSGKHVDSYAECVRRILELVAKSLGVPKEILS